MYKALLVDDERLIREGLRGLIDWGAQGFEVAVAADGVEALEHGGVDLVIADIRMPRMDGLELLETLRARGSDVAFLILSGFAEFEYAQRASSLRIDGYLLKPVDENELLRRLTEVRQRLDAQRFSALSLIRGGVRLPAAYDWGRWQLVLLAPLTAGGQAPLLDPAAERRLRAACEAEDWGEVFVEPPLVGLLLRRVFPGGRNLDLLARAAAEALGPAWFAGAAGEVLTDPARLPESHARVWELLQHRFFFEPNTIVSTWTAGEVATDSDALTEKLALALASGPAAVRGAVAACGALAGTGDEQSVKESLARIVSGALWRYLGAEGHTPAFRSRLAEWTADLWKQPFLSTLLPWLTEKLEGAVRDRGADSGLAQRLVELIETRYAENLKLESLAEAFQYNSAYLGKLFRQKTGAYFNTYLDRVRIRHARELLAQGLKVYQVAELVGYKYVDYFHAKFKKYTGMSPTQYRGGLS